MLGSIRSITTVITVGAVALALAAPGALAGRDRGIGVAPSEQQEPVSDAFTRYAGNNAPIVSRPQGHPAPPATQRPRAQLGASDPDASQLVWALGTVAAIVAFFGAAVSVRRQRTSLRRV